MNIKITSDSTCDLPASVLEQYHIDLVPLIVMKEDEEFLDNVTITPGDIFAHVENGGALCSTAARSVAVYQELFSKFAEYDGVLHISLGSGFSSSFQNAYLAAQSFSNVRVVDSQSLSSGHGLMVLKAAQLSQEGCGQYRPAGPVCPECSGSGTCQSDPGIFCPGLIVFSATGAASGGFFGENTMNEHLLLDLATDLAYEIALSGGRMPQSPANSASPALHPKSSPNPAAPRKWPNKLMGRL